MCKVVGLLITPLVFLTFYFEVELFNLKVPISLIDKARLDSLKCYSRVIQSIIKECRGEGSLKEHGA